jgi:hypothetical protein
MTAAITLVLLAQSTALSSADKRIRPLSHDEVAQVWIGLSEDELYIFRLVLERDGTGTAGYVFSDEEPKLFRITSWSYDGERIEIALAAVSPSSADIETLSGTLVGIAMKLTMEGRGWKRRLFLRPERDLERRWEKLKGTMSDLGDLTALDPMPEIEMSDPALAPAQWWGPLSLLPGARALDLAFEEEGRPRCRRDRPAPSRPPCRAGCSIEEGLDEGLVVVG